MNTENISNEYGKKNDKKNCSKPILWKRRCTMKKQMILKRIAPILVVFCIFATILPTTVFAADTPKIT